MINTTTQLLIPAKFAPLPAFNAPLSPIAAVFVLTELTFPQHFLAYLA